MKEQLKKQAGMGLIAIILIVVVVVAGGGAAALGIRMLVAGDGNYLKPFEDLGWIESEDDDDEKEEKSSKKKSKDKDIDEDDDDDKDDKDNKKDKDDETDTEKDKTSGKNMAKYLVESTRLSAESKKSDTKHYYGDIPIADEIGGADDEFADLYKLMKAGINVYAKDGKAVEIEFGFDVTEFCEEAYKQFKDDFNAMGMTSSESLQSMMMLSIESMFDEMDDEYSEYIKKYVDGGSLQLYVTEKGFEAIYDEYDIEEGEKDVDKIIDALEEAFNTTISLVKD